MTLKREIKDAYIEGGASIYVKTHSNAVYVDNNETETLTQRLDNVKDSIAKHTSQLNANAKMHFIDLKDSDGNSLSGDCSVIQLEKENIIVDFGENTALQSVKDYLSKNNISKIKYAIITHYHSDHVGGFKDIAKIYGIEKLYLPCNPTWTNMVNGSEGITTDYSSVYTDIVSFCNLNNIDIVYPSENEVITIDNAKLEFFNCSEEVFQRGDYYNKTVYGTVFTNTTVYNNFSMCFKLEIKNHVIYFTGDIEKDAQKNLIENFNACDILKIPHHLFNFNEYEEFYSKTNCNIAIAMNKSLNKNKGYFLANKYSKKIYCTCNSGNIKIDITINNISINSEKTETENEITECYNNFKYLIGSDNNTTFEEFCKNIPIGSYVNCNIYATHSICPEPFKTWNSGTGYFLIIQRIDENTWTGLATLKNKDGYINNLNSAPKRTTIMAFSAGNDSNNNFTYEFTTLQQGKRIENFENGLFVSESFVIKKYYPDRIKELKIRLYNNNAGENDFFTVTNDVKNNGGIFLVNMHHITDSGLLRMYVSCLNCVYNSDDNTFTIIYDYCKRISFREDGTQAFTKIITKNKDDLNYPGIEGYSCS